MESPDYPSGVVLRNAEARDAATLAEFNLRLAWETEHLRLDPDTVRRGVEALLADPGKGHYFVAEFEDRVIGQCCVTFEWSDWRNGLFWWLQSVYVDAAWRGRGIFRALYRHVETLGRRDGIIGLRLYVERENLPAQTAYERRGMHRTRYEIFEQPWVRV